jgi:hypothetical protein
MVFIFGVKKMAYVHNSVPEIDISLNSSRHGMSEKMK